MPHPEEKTLSLEQLQSWFGSVISRPLPPEYPANPLHLSAPEVRAEAGQRLRSKGGLDGFGRLGIYNQQYWFRLISVMQSDYACAIHLMGLRPFNDWAVRYLTAHPPASPFLADLDARFPDFLEAEYQGAGRQAVLQAVAYERALSKAFDAVDGVPLASAGFGDPADPAALLSARLRLAPHLTPLHVDWDFAEYRARCLPDESLEQDIRPLPGSADLVIFRDRDLQVMKQPVAAAALAVLLEFRNPASLTEAFANLEGRLGAAGQAEMEAGLSGWFQEWVAKGWLCIADTDSRQ